MLLSSRGALVAASVLLAVIVALGIVVGRSVGTRDDSGRPQSLVIVGYGGSYGDALREAVIVPFRRETGIDVTYDETCCARIGAVIESGAFAGDLAAGVDFGGLLSWERQRYVDDDMRFVDASRKADIAGRYSHPGVFVPTEYDYVIAAHGKDTNLPASWAEFWNVNRYPGQRALIRATPAGQLEAALLADGVAPDRLYPLDVDRAIASLERLRKSTTVVFADSPSQLVDMLARGDARCAIAFSNRVEAARRDGLPISFSYTQGLRTGNGFALLKGTRNRDAALAFVEFLGRPSVLARFAKLAALRPATGAASGVPDIALDSIYWGKHRVENGEKWVKWLVR